MGTKSRSERRRSKKSATQQKPKKQQQQPKKKKKTKRGKKTTQKYTARSARDADRSRNYIESRGTDVTFPKGRPSAGILGGPDVYQEYTLLLPPGARVTQLGFINGKLPPAITIQSDGVSPTFKDLRGLSLPAVKIAIQDFCAKKAAKVSAYAPGSPGSLSCRYDAGPRHAHLAKNGHTDQVPWAFGTKTTERFSSGQILGRDKCCVKGVFGDFRTANDEGKEKGTQPVLSFEKGTNLIRVQIPSATMSGSVQLHAKTEAKADELDKDIAATLTAGDGGYYLESNGDVQQQLNAILRLAHASITFRAIRFPEVRGVISICWYSSQTA